MTLSPWAKLARGTVATVALMGLLAATIIGGASAQEMAPTVGEGDGGDLGTILVGPNGMTLYTYTRDVPGLSNCYGQCAVNWPPLLTDSDPTPPEGLAGLLGTTMRQDGTWQVTYNGWPLYYWVNDAQPGDTTGQNVGGVWFVANPTPAPTLQVRDDPELGPILVDARGWTLYLYTRDTPGTSNCYDQCAVNWPPLMATDDLRGPDPVAAGLGTTTRTDGSLQVMYNDTPLYYWARDTKPGDTMGQNVGGVWFVVAP
jgi:predicted lipoprotein with Yx(FWY)xxD motif